MLLTDDDAERIKRELGGGVRGPVLIKWIEQLLDDRAERVRAARQVAPDASGLGVAVGDGFVRSKPDEGRMP
jgi:hypothetical protein